MTRFTDTQAQMLLKDSQSAKTLQHNCDQLCVLILNRGQFT
jgi:hypothetical protein